MFRVRKKEKKKKTSSTFPAVVWMRWIISLYYIYIYIYIYIACSVEEQKPLTWKLLKAVRKLSNIKKKNTKV